MRTSRDLPIDRASAADLMQLASDRAGAPVQVAALLLLGPGSRCRPDQVREVLEARTRAVPRLRQRLVRAPWGCGRPVWVDDPDFDIGAQLRFRRWSGDDAELLRLGADLATEPLPAGRPLWSVTYLDGPAGGRSALVVVLHHVIADGIGGLTILAGLLDGGPEAPVAVPPAPPPTAGRLFADATGTRLRSVRRWRAVLPAVRAAAAELAPARGIRAARCSLNRPTGPLRRLGVTDADLTAVRTAARAHGGTVNDVVLTAVTGALGTVLARRGEPVERLVVSVPVSARRRADAGRLGNQVGVIPVELPATGAPAERLAAIAAITRARKTAAPGSSVAVLAPVFRAVAAIGLAHRYLDRQHLINTLVTNVRGPQRPLAFLGRPVTGIVPVSPITGNVTVGFAALSYAGRVGVTVIADPAHCPDLPELVSFLQDELDLLTGERAPSTG